MTKPRKKPAKAPRTATKPVVTVKPKTAAVRNVAPPQPRENTKQAKLIALLRRPGGATLDDLTKVTGWQPHTVRGAISGALKKKLELSVTSEKAEDGERVYRVVG